MKKLFVSVPMKGRTQEEIKKSIEKMHKIAEIITGEELELIDSVVADRPPVGGKESVWYLSKSIEFLSQADLVIGISDCYEWNGCAVEREVAERYDIPFILVRPEWVIDNYRELMEKLYKRATSECTNVPRAKF